MLLKCVSCYPADPKEMNLRSLVQLKEKYGCCVGFSDHTLGVSVPISAVTLGASFVEKHFILDKSIGGPDASFSMDESEFSNMVSAVRDAEKSIGEITYDLTQKQIQGKAFSRSLYIVRDVKKGEILTEKNIRSISWRIS